MLEIQEPVEQLVAHLVFLVYLFLEVLVALREPAIQEWRDQVVGVEMVAAVALAGVVHVLAAVAALLEVIPEILAKPDQVLNQDVLSQATAELALQVVGLAAMLSHSHLLALLHLANHRMRVAEEEVVVLVLAEMLVLPDLQILEVRDLQQLHQQLQML
jgi:hypothetical protein